MMEFALNEDQRMLGEAARRFFSERHPVANARVAANAGDPKVRQLWKDVADMGFLSLLIPESEGGVGLGMVDAWIVQEAAGAALFGLPLVQAMVLWPVLGRSDQADVRLCAARVAAGEECRIAALNNTGREEFEIDWMADSGEVHLLSSSPGDDLLRIRCVKAALPRQAVDPSFCRAMISTRGVPSGSSVARNYEDLEQRLHLSWAAHAVGAASQSLQSTCDYANEREQFGRPIGANQSIKHRLANHWMALDNARLAGHFAASCLDSGMPGTSFACAAAIACSVDAAAAVVADAIQVHGAIGFSWEHDCHLYFKRVMHINGLLGASDKLFEKVWSVREEAVH